jgi:hypothetical protein
MLEFMVIECYSFKKIHLLVCYVCNLYDARINLRGKAQIFCKGKDFGLKIKRGKFSNSKYGYTDSRKVRPFWLPFKEYR